MHVCVCQGLTATLFYSLHRLIVKNVGVVVVDGFLVKYDDVRRNGELTSERRRRQKIGRSALRRKLTLNTFGLFSYLSLDAGANLV